MSPEVHLLSRSVGASSTSSYIKSWQSSGERPIEPSSSWFLSKSPSGSHASSHLKFTSYLVQFPTPPSRRFLISQRGKIKAPSHRIRFRLNNMNCSVSIREIQIHPASFPSSIIFISKIEKSTPLPSKNHPPGPPFPLNPSLSPTLPGIWRDEGSSSLTVEIMDWGWGCSVWGGFIPAMGYRVYSPADFLVCFWLGA